MYLMDEYALVHKIADFCLGQVINENPDLPWDWHMICKDCNMTMDFVKKNSSRLPNLNNFCLKSHVTIDFIRSHRDLKWDWWSLSRNSYMTLDIIADNLDEEWNWTQISMRTDITMDLVEKYPDLPWDYNGLSQNPNLTMEFILNNLDKPWFWFRISKNIELDNVAKYPDLPWDYKKLSQNPNLTMEFIDQHPDLPWDCYSVYDNLGIKMRCSKRTKCKCKNSIYHRTMEVSLDRNKKYYDKFRVGLFERFINRLTSDSTGECWDWKVIVADPRIPLEVVERYPNKPWAFKQKFYKQGAISTHRNWYYMRNDRLVSNVKRREQKIPQYYLVRYNEFGALHEKYSHSECLELLFSLIKLNKTMVEVILAKSSQTKVYKEKLIQTVLHPLKLCNSLNKFWYDILV